MAGLSVPAKSCSRRTGHVYCRSLLASSCSFSASSLANGEFGSGSLPRGSWLELQVRDGRLSSRRSRSRSRRGGRPERSRPLGRAPGARALIRRWSGARAAPGARRAARPAFAGFARRRRGGGDADGRAAPRLLADRARRRGVGASAAGACRRRGRWRCLAGGADLRASPPDARDGGGGCAARRRARGVRRAAGRAATLRSSRARRRQPRQLRLPPAAASGPAAGPAMARPRPAAPHRQRRAVPPRLHRALRLGGDRRIGRRLGRSRLIDAPARRRAPASARARPRRAPKSRRRASASVDVSAGAADGSARRGGGRLRRLLRRRFRRLGRLPAPPVWAASPCDSRASAGSRRSPRPTRR